MKEIWPFCQIQATKLVDNAAKRQNSNQIVDIGKGADELNWQRKLSTIIYEIEQYRLQQYTCE